MADIAPFTVTQALRRQPGRSLDTVGDVRDDAVPAVRLAAALGTIADRWWVGDYAGDASHRHRDVPDATSLAAQLTRDFDGHARVVVRWTGQDLLIEGGRWHRHPLACFTPLSAAYCPAATLLASLPPASAYPARDAMDFDVPVSTVTQLLLAGGSGDPVQLLPAGSGPVSGMLLLTAVQACFLQLPSAQWRQLCHEAAGWHGSLRELVDHVAKPLACASSSPGSKARRARTPTAQRP